jgi:ABC-2 type transport system ATP-binding protein
MNPILAIENVSKKFGSIRALDRLSLEVPAGSVFGILGPNGSGKTTLLGITMDIIRANSGSYRWFGEPGTAAARKKIGALLETPNFYHYLSARQNLEITCAIKGHDGSGIDEALELLGLSERQHSAFSVYSLGMKQRLALAACIVTRPGVLVLDEPTNGLDPEGIADVRVLIKKWHSEGKTIIIASHMLDEIEKICTHVAILRKGRLMAAGPVDEVLGNEDQVDLRSLDRESLYAALLAFPGILRLQRENDSIRVFFPKGKAVPGELFQYCADKGLVLQHLQVGRKSLETGFLELIHQQ